MLEESGPMRVIEQMIDALNKEDIDGVLTRLADDILIVDDISPFRRIGIGAAKTWLESVIHARNRLHTSLDLGAQTRSAINSSAAYVVAQARLSIGASGGSADLGGVLTFTLREVDGSWLIDTIVWSGPDGILSPQPR